MPTVATAIVKIAADIGDFDKGLVKAQKQLLKTAETMESWGKKLSLGFTAPLAAASAVLARSAAEDAASLSKLQRAFGANAQAMEKFVGQMMKVTPATDDQLRQLVANTQAFNLSLGMTPQKATAMTQAITRMAADLAAYNHVELSTASEAITSALEGKTKALKSLNVVVDAAAVKQKGLAAIEARMTVMRGEAARTIGEDANAWARFKQSLDSASDSMGQAVLPTFAKILDAGGAVAKRIAGMDDATKQLVVTLGIAVGAIGPLEYAVAKLTKGYVALTAAITALSEPGALGGLAAKFAAVAVPIALIVAPMLAVAHAIDKEGEAARNARKQFDDYSSALAGLSRASVLAQTNINAGMAKKLEPRRQALLQQIAALPEAGTPGYDIDKTPAERARLNAEYSRITSQQTLYQDLAGIGTKTLKTMTDTTPPPAIVSAFDTMIDRAKALTKEQNDTRLVTDQLTRSVLELTSAYGALAGQFDTVSLKQRDTLRSAMDDATTALFGDLSKVPGSPSAMVNHNIHPDSSGVSAGQRALNNSWGVIANLQATKITAVYESVGEKQLSAFKAGFAEVATAIGSTLASNLASLFGGGRGAQFGATIFGGAGGAAAKAALGTSAGAIAGSVIPVLGTIAGGIIGSAIGSMFDHKRAVEKNTEALQKLNESLTNEPTGFKLAPYNYLADKGQTAGGMFAGATINVYPRDPDDFMRKMNRYGDYFTARGGVAFAGG